MPCITCIICLCWNDSRYGGMITDCTGDEAWWTYTKTLTLAALLKKNGVYLCESQSGFSRLLSNFTVNFQNDLRFMKLLSDIWKSLFSSQLLDILCIWLWSVGVQKSESMIILSPECSVWAPDAFNFWYFRDFRIITK